jgi:hypothetical protein
LQGYRLKALRPVFTSFRHLLGFDAAQPGPDTTTDFAETHAPELSMATAFVDSIQLPLGEGEPEDETIVRPSLAILFRMAVGPAADFYAPRFLEYERVGRSFPSWNWAPLLAPAVWAIYRRLWLPGLAFIAWPLLAIAVFWIALRHLADINAIGLVGTAIVVWFIPSIVGALIGNTLLYRRARHLVGTAEARTTQTDKAARWLSRRAVVAPVQAAATTAAMVVALGAVLPNLQSAYADQVVRSRITGMMAAIQPLQRQLEEWFISNSPSDAPQIDMAEARPGAELFEKVNVSLTNGRVRLALGASIPELYGRSILLAPTIDRRRQVRWICIPVDIPARYLPEECRQG